MTNHRETRAESEPDFYEEDATAQDVIDALRLAFMGCRDAAERGRLTDALLDHAPETDSDRGTKFVLHLLSEGLLTARVKDGPR